MYKCSEQNEPQEQAAFGPFSALRTSCTAHRITGEVAFKCSQNFHFKNDRAPSHLILPVKMGGAVPPANTLLRIRITNFANFRPPLPCPPRPVRKIRSFQTGTTRPMRPPPRTRLPSESSAQAPSPPDTQAPQAFKPEASLSRIGAPSRSPNAYWADSPQYSHTASAARRCASRSEWISSLKYSPGSGTFWGVNLLRAAKHHRNRLAKPLNLSTVSRI